MPFQPPSSKTLITKPDEDGDVTQEIKEESGCDFVAIYIVFVLQDRCRREIEDCAELPQAQGSCF